MIQNSTKIISTATAEMINVVNTESQTPKWQQRTAAGRFEVVGQLEDRLHMRPRPRNGP